MRSTPITFCLAGLLAGCVGELDAGAARPVPNPALPRGSCEQPVAPSAPMRRITEAQFQATVRAVFGESLDLDDYPAPATERGYRTFATAGTVSTADAIAIADLALAVGDAIAEDLPTALGCAPTDASDDACVHEWIADVLTRAYRRSPLAGELSIHERLYADLRGDGFTPSESVSAVVEAIVQSPALLYAHELGEVPAGAAPGTIVALDDHEVAQRLAFFLWDAPPDEALQLAADSGELRTASQVEAHARRMVDDPRIARMLGRFVEDWLELHRLDTIDKSAERFPEWRAGLADSVEREPAAFIEEVVLRRDARFETLLGATFAMVDGPLAAVYGVDAPADPSAFVAVELDPSERRGILGQAAFLASHAGATEPAPVVRGATILRNVLCVPIELPEGVMIASPAPDPTRTVRQRFAEHRSDPSCATCHEQIDPIGFGLENFDAIGRFRLVEEESELDIDASGLLRNAGSADGAFVGGAELSQRLSQSEVARDCFARQLYQHAQARFAGGTDDACVLSRLRDTFEATDGDLRELLVAIATSEPFLSRRVPE